MIDFIEQLLAEWDAKASPGVGFHPYQVAPRQGRYTVQRRLLRRLQRRIAFPSELAVVSTFSKQ